jgi:hypothetical protein
MLHLTDDSFRFNTTPPAPAGIELMMDAITKGLEPFLDGRPFPDHVEAALVIEKGMVQVTMTALSPFGVSVLGRFTGEE